MTAEPITRQKIDEWKRLAEKVTPGPWSVRGISVHDGSISFGSESLRIVIGYVTNAASFGDFVSAALNGRHDFGAPDTAITQHANAAFIAAAREAVPALILEVERLTAALDSERKEGEWIETCAKVADAYERRMTDAAVKLGAKGRPHFVADCKADAGLSIAADIRKLAFLPLPPIQQGE